MSDVPSYPTGDLLRWALDREFDIRTREFEHSLRVGPGKPLGSHGFSSGFWGWYHLLTSGRLPWTLGSDIRVCTVVTDRLWVYARYEPSLLALLDRRGAMLDDSGWPRDCLGFVQRTRDELVRPMTPLYDLIADCYGDKLNPGRTDVLPGVPRERLLEAYIQVHFHADPASIYFADGPTAYGPRPTANNQRPTAYGPRPTANEQRPTGDGQQTTADG